MIRCALKPNEPRLIEGFMRLGLVLVERGQLSPWQQSRTCLNLLIDTAKDTALPWHWRTLCLDCAWRPLHSLRQLITTPAQQQYFDKMRYQLTGLQLQPSLSVSELAEGNPYQ